MFPAPGAPLREQGGAVGGGGGAAPGKPLMWSLKARRPLAFALRKHVLPDTHREYLCVRVRGASGGQVVRGKGQVSVVEVHSTGGWAGQSMFPERERGFVPKGRWRGFVADTVQTLTGSVRGCSPLHKHPPASPTHALQSGFAAHKAQHWAAVSTGWWEPSWRSLPEKSVALTNSLQVAGLLAVTVAMKASSAKAPTARKEGMVASGSCVGWTAVGQNASAPWNSFHPLLLPSLPSSPSGSR